MDKFWNFLNIEEFPDTESMLIFACGKILLDLNCYSNLENKQIFLKLEIGIILFWLLDFDSVSQLKLDFKVIIFDNESCQYLLWIDTNGYCMSKNSLSMMSYN